MARMYKVGFYISPKSIEYFKQRAAICGERLEGLSYFCDNLYPMTHSQACTFKSNMMQPSNHFLYDV